VTTTLAKTLHELKTPCIKNIKHGTRTSNYEV